MNHLAIKRAENIKAKQPGIDFAELEWCRLEISLAT